MARLDMTKQREDARLRFATAAGPSSALRRQPTRKKADIGMARNIWMIGAS
jgi:hypothetical protein